MEYPGVTTYEPTWLHLFLFVVAVVAVTYPLSYLLILSGKIQPRNRFLTGWRARVWLANQIVRKQVEFAIMAWLIGVVACSLLLFFGLLAVGTLFRILELLGWAFSWNDLGTFGIGLCGIIHLVAQGIAYRQAVRDTQDR